MRPRRPVGLLRPALSRALSRLSRRRADRRALGVYRGDRRRALARAAQARAIENQCYVLAAAQGGTHANGRRTYGHSVLIDPWGVVVAELADGEGVIVGDIDAVPIARSGASCRLCRIAGWPDGARRG